MCVDDGLTSADGNSGVHATIIALPKYRLLSQKRLRKNSNVDKLQAQNSQKNQEKKFK